MAPPLIWLRCSTCKLTMRLRPTKSAIVMEKHHDAKADKKPCPGQVFEVLPNLTEEEARRADVEVDRRQKLWALKFGRGQRRLVSTRGTGTSRFDGTRSMRFRPSRGGAGAPTLGKKR
jgi:hypothetical protein